MEVRYSIDDGKTYGGRPDDLNTVTHIQVFVPRNGSNTSFPRVDVAFLPAARTLVLQGRHPHYTAAMRGN